MEEINNEINNNLNNNINKNIQIEQQKFFQTNIGKIINTTINAGLRYILPDIIEEQLINIKDAILENGFREGLNTAIDEGINFGKSALGIITGKFDNIEQMQNAIKNGGIIDNVSKLIDYSVNKANSKGKINNNITNLIKNSKNILLDNINSNIESMMEKQEDLFNKLNKYVNTWKNYYNNKDFNGMEKTYKKIETLNEKIIPIEKLIEERKNIENLHLLIKNNGKNFDISDEEKNLAKIL